jgi:hypothetical protein
MQSGQVAVFLHPDKMQDSQAGWQGLVNAQKASFISRRKEAALRIPA